MTVTVAVGRMLLLMLTPDSDRRNEPEILLPGSKALGLLLKRRLIIATVIVTVTDSEAQASISDTASHSRRAPGPANWQLEHSSSSPH